MAWVSGSNPLTLTITSNTRVVASFVDNYSGVITQFCTNNTKYGHTTRSDSFVVPTGVTKIHYAICSGGRSHCHGYGSPQASVIKNTRTGDYANSENDAQYRSTAGHGLSFTHSGGNYGHCHNNKGGWNSGWCTGWLACQPGDTISYTVGGEGHYAGQGYVMYEYGGEVERS